ncbi:MAG: hypothetical protein JRK26_17925 [Deltaproteobacteria bacterium]|nr:hypothetical protein [Deltaproteobacteria bacterium]
MKVQYAKHLKNRLSLRNIEYDIPKKVFQNADERYFDNETGHLIAVSESELYGKTRELMVAYEKEDDTITLLTIHPLKRGQKNKRIKNKRWRRF